MGFIEDKKLFQRWLGVKEDGEIGPISIAAAIEKLGLRRQPIAHPELPGIVPPSSAEPKMKVCIDAGHGMSNRGPGIYDSGAAHNGDEEASITLQWAQALDQAFRNRGIETFMTRNNATDPTPVGTRARRAEAAGCNRLIAIHVNDSDSWAANGTETLYHGENEKQMAESIQTALLNGLHLTNRGIKQREDLAVLKFNGKEVLIELGFIRNPTDLKAIKNPSNIHTTCGLIADAILKS
jgi:N-acetylmuramoyl-L-alanine amidase